MAPHRQGPRGDDARVSQGSVVHTKLPVVVRAQQLLVDLQHSAPHCNECNGLVDTRSLGLIDTEHDSVMDLGDMHLGNSKREVMMDCVSVHRVAQNGVLYLLQDANILHHTAAQPCFR